MSEIRPEFKNRAFPHLDEWGLSKREYFAAMAMQGMLSADANYSSRIPCDAVAIADAIICELERNQPIR